MLDAVELAELRLELLEIARVASLLVDLAILLDLMALLLLKVGELVEEHGQAHIVLKVHQNVENVDYLVLNLHDNFVVWSLFISLLL